MNIKELTKELCEIPGLFGYENEIRTRIECECKPYADDMFTDNLGNLYVFKRGVHFTPRPVLLCAHMDEVGFLVSGITEDGLLTVRLIGGVDPLNCVGKQVIVGEAKHPGILSVCFKKDGSATPDDIRIDVGAESNEQASRMVKIGEPVTFKVDSMEISEDVIVAKASDDRAGCAVLIALLHEELDYDTWLVFSNGEEPGLFGSYTIADRIKPVACLALESASVMDRVSLPASISIIHIGGGAAVYEMDAGCIYSMDLCRLVEEAADKHQVKWQHRAMKYGMTDAFYLRLTGGGVPSFCVGIPARYLHTASSLFCMSDVIETIKFAKLFIAVAGNKAIQCNGGVD